MNAISAGIAIDSAIVVIYKALLVYKDGYIPSVSLDFPRIAVFQQAADVLICHCKNSFLPVWPVAKPNGAEALVFRDARRHFAR